MGNLSYHNSYLFHSNEYHLFIIIQTVSYKTISLHCYIRFLSLSLILKIPHLCSHSFQTFSISFFLYVDSYKNTPWFIYLYISNCGFIPTNRPKVPNKFNSFVRTHQLVELSCSRFLMCSSQN